MVCRPFDHASPPPRPLASTPRSQTAHVQNYKSMEYGTTLLRNFGPTIRVAMLLLITIRKHLEGVLCDVRTEKHYIRKVPKYSIN